jgi:hypothetical protein
MADGESSPLAPRAPFASGEFLTRFPPGSAHALRLDCRREKPGWQPRLPGGLIEATFAGTAVLFEGRYYEVVAARSVGGWVSYYLDPWDDACVLRRIVELSPEATAREAASRRTELGERSTATALALLTPLVGLLPAEVQQRIELRYGLPASRATSWSAALMLAVSSALFVLGLGTAFAGAQGAAGAPAPPASAPAKYFMLESILRLGAGLAAGEANGTLPVVALFWLWRLVSRRPRLAPREVDPAAATARALQGESEDPSPSSDRVVAAAGEPGGLEVVSLLPKPHWTKATGIHYRDRWYRLTSAAGEADARGAWHFRLTEDPNAISMRSACEYDPREIGELIRRAEIARHATWVETLAPVWGLLGEADQRRLAEIYVYLPERATGWSILGSAVFGGLAVGLAGVYLATGTGDAFDLFALVAGGTLLADAIRRLRGLRRGVLLASWLEPFARPFARRFLSVSSPPDAR